ncbi:MAG TPA: DUF3108 domain-containing protein [Burkholderiales bacterium]|nr:DUF3108 domain-containing protein [Burkholderiales bacterium]
MRRWILATALSLAAAASPATAAPPEHVAIDYDIIYNGGPLAKARHVLEHDAKTYRLKETWQGSGLLALLGEILRTSEGRITAQGLKPLVYTDKRPRREPARARFDWEAGTLVQEFRGPPRTEPIPPHAQDRLSFLFAPAFHPPGKGPVEFSVVDGKGTSHYVFDVIGRERLKVPAGEFDALHLRKRDDDGQTTDFWLDAGHAYLPLRIRIMEKDGKTLDQVAARIGPPT